MNRLIRSPPPISVKHLDCDRLIRSVCREQSQKDLLGILKNVCFLSQAACYNMITGGLVVDTELRSLISFVMRTR